METRELNQWQILVLENALAKAIARGDVFRPDGDRLLSLLYRTDSITVRGNYA